MHLVGRRKVCGLEGSRISSRAMEGESAEDARGGAGDASIAALRCRRGICCFYNRLESSQRSAVSLERSRSVLGFQFTSNKQSSIAMCFELELCPCVLPADFNCPTVVMIAGSFKGNCGAQMRRLTVSRVPKPKYQEISKVLSLRSN